MLIFYMALSLLDSFCTEPEVEQHPRSALPPLDGCEEGLTLLDSFAPDVPIEKVVHRADPHIAVFAPPVRGVEAPSTVACRKAGSTRGRKKGSTADACALRSLLGRSNVPADADSALLSR